MTKGAARFAHRLTGGNPQIGRELGTGKFSRVCEAVHNTTGEKMAVKIINKDSMQAVRAGSRVEAPLPCTPRSPLPLHARLCRRKRTLCALRSRC